MNLLKTHFFIAFAYLGETRADVWETVRLIFAEYPDSPGLSIAHPVPGTPFCDLVRDRLIQDADNDDEYVGSGRQLGFRANYPSGYYRRLSRYIEGRRALNASQRSLPATLFEAVRICPNMAILRATELLWSVIFQDLEVVVSG